MWFWWFMLCCDMLIPVTMVVFGRWMWKHPPKSVSSVMGYRTSRSMKNEDTWRFAQDYCGRLWWKLGWLLMIPSFLVHIPVYGGSEDTIGTVGGVLVTIQLILLTGSILPTERALKKTFTKDGIRK